MSVSVCAMTNRPNVCLICLREFDELVKFIVIDLKFELFKGIDRKLVT